MTDWLEKYTPKSKMSKFMLEEACKPSATCIINRVDDHWKRQREYTIIYNGGDTQLQKGNLSRRHCVSSFVVVGLRVLSGHLVYHNQIY